MIKCDFSIDLSDVHVPHIIPTEPSTINDFYLPQYNATIVGKELLNKTGEKGIFSIKIKPDTPGDVKHLPGDTIYLQCPNSPENIAFIIDKLGRNNNNNNNLFTIEYIKWKVDLTHFPSKTFLKRLAEQQEEKTPNTLLIYAMATHKRATPASKAYMTWAKDGVTVCDILYTMSDLTISLETLLLLPPPPPRQYSLANSSHNGCDEIIFSSTKTPFGRLGLASNYLEKVCAVGDRVILSPEFHLLHPTLPLRIREPTKYKKALIICAGTAISPFLMAVREGVLRPPNGNDGDCCCRFIYGCRTMNDFIYRNEFESFPFSVALSREDGVYNDDDGDGDGDSCVDNGLRKTTMSTKTTLYHRKYVQDILELSIKEDLYDLIHGKLTLYLCGEKLSMIKGVTDVLIKSLIDDFGMKDEDARKKMAELDIVKEVWI